MTPPKATIFILGTSALTFLSPGLYGMLGGAGFYVNEISQNPSLFKITNMLVYCFLGFIAGFIVHDLSTQVLGVSYPGLLIASGFSVRKLAEIADRYVSYTVIKK